MLRNFCVRLRIFKQHCCRRVLHQLIEFFRAFWGKRMPAAHEGFGYCTVSAMVVELVMAVTPLLD